MAEPIWLTRLVVELIHLEQLAEHGGRRGVRDEHALESAVARPRQRFADGSEPDLAKLASTLCFGIVQNHPFVDGNKRVGFLAAFTFLRLNGLDLNAEDAEVVEVMEGVAAGDVSEADLAGWLGAHVRPTV